MHIKNITTHFNAQNIKGKALALILEHSPCCLLSLAASSLGVQAFNHNPAIELGFAVGGAIAGEYIGHRFFCREAKSTASGPLKRYGIALAFGLSTWGIHQELFHDHSHKEIHERHSDERKEEIPLRYNAFSDTNHSHHHH